MSCLEDINERSSRIKNVRWHGNRAAFFELCQDEFPIPERSSSKKCLTSARAFSSPLPLIMCPMAPKNEIKTWNPPSRTIMEPIPDDGSALEIISRAFQNSG
ncbi:hypothetical protein ACJJTC_001894 [Scirpophaga incertulas]